MYVDKFWLKFAKEPLGTSVCPRKKCPPNLSITLTKSLESTMIHCYCLMLLLIAVC